MRFLQRFLTRKRLIVLILLLAVGGFLYFRSRPAPVEKTFTQVKKDTIRESLSVSGTVDAEEKAQLHFLTSGKLTFLGIKAGDAVAQWQLVASQDVAEVQKNLQKELNNYLTTRAEFDQQKEDVKDKVLTDTLKRLVDQQQYALNNSVLDVEIATLAFQNAALYSPISGIAVSVPVTTAGVNVAASDAFEIVNPSTLEFAAEVDEGDIGLAREGQRAQIVLDAYPDDTVDTQISRLDFKSSTSDSGGTVFIVHLLLPEQINLRYRLGMSGEAEIILQEKKDTLVIPLEALREEGDQAFVWVVREGKEEKWPVKTGIESDEMIEITEGLAEGETIVLSERTPNETAS